MLQKGGNVMAKHNESNLLTRECILTALLRLMETEPYESISITDITNLAGVSRMAYYRNYKSKDEILLSHLEEAEEKLIEEIGYGSASTIKEIILYIFKYIQENAAVIQAIYDAGLNHLLSRMLSQRIMHYFPVVYSTKEGRYAVPFYAGAILSVFHLWFDNGMKESSEEMAEIISSLINRDYALDLLVVPENK